jgi:hypothetical protein
MLELLDCYAGVMDFNAVFITKTATNRHKICVKRYLINSNSIGRDRCTGDRVLRTHRACDLKSQCGHLARGASAGFARQIDQQMR